jgi:hypothetical protein
MLRSSVSLLLARSRHSDHVAGTSASARKAGLRDAMSAFDPISFGSPLGADHPGRAPEGLELTLAV